MRFAIMPLLAVGWGAVLAAIGVACCLHTGAAVHEGSPVVSPTVSLTWAPDGAADGAPEVGVWQTWQTDSFPISPQLMWPPPECSDLVIEDNGQRVATYDAGTCEPCVRGCADIATEHYQRHGDYGDGGIHGIAKCIVQCRFGFMPNGKAYGMQ